MATGLSVAMESFISGNMQVYIPNEMRKFITIRLLVCAMFFTLVVRREPRPWLPRPSPLQKLVIVLYWLLVLRKLLTFEINWFVEVSCWRTPRLTRCFSSIFEKDRGCTRPVNLSTNKDTWSTRNVQRWWCLDSEAYFWIPWYVSRNRERYQCSRVPGRGLWPACDLLRVLSLCSVNHDAFLGEMMGCVHSVPLNQRFEHACVVLRVESETTLKMCLLKRWERGGRSFQVWLPFLILCVGSMRPVIRVIRRLTTGRWALIGYRLSIIRYPQHLFLVSGCIFCLVQQQCRVNGERIHSSFLATGIMPIKLTRQYQLRDEQRCRLLELPLEVLTEVLIRLDWQDVLHPRQVSHYCTMLLNLPFIYQIQ